MSKQEIFVVGGEFVNKGAEAMTLTVLNEVLSRQLSDHITMFSGVGTNGSIAFNVNDRTRFIRIVEQLRKSTFVMTYLLPMTIAKVLVGKRERDKLSVLKNTDILVDISGFSMSSNFGRRNWLGTARKLLIVSLFKKLGARYFILPQAVGPFLDWKLRLIAKKVFRKADLIILRDQKSKSYVDEFRLEEKVCVKPDIAFLFDIKTEDQIACARKSYISDLVVAFAPNMRVYERSFDENGRNKYIEVIRALIERLSESAKILLIPHEIKVDGGRDDVYLCNEIVKSGMLDRVDSFEIVNKVTATELKDVICGADIVVASRFHTAVAALSCGIPTMTIGWADKYKELLRLFGLEEFSLDFRELDDEQIHETFQSLLKKRAEIAHLIRHRLPTILEGSKQVFDLVEQAIDR